MKHSINFYYITKAIEAEKAAALLKASGITCLDYTPPVEMENWKAIMYDNIKIFEKYGLKVHQTHAPFNRYGTYGSEFAELTKRALSASLEMGAQFMVAHGDEFDFEKESYSPEKALSYNYELFAPIVEAAEKKGLNIAFENVFEDGLPQKRFCSEAEELKELILKFNSRCVSCCWDFGHAHVAFKEKQAEKIEYMKNLITCTHVHDNSHGTDLHLPPFYGEINWKDCMKALKKSGYSGNLSFEFVYGAIPEAVAKAFLDSVYNTGEYLKKLFDN